MRSIDESLTVAVFVCVCMGEWVVGVRVFSLAWIGVDLAFAVARWSLNVRMIR